MNDVKALYREQINLLVSQVSWKMESESHVVELISFSFEILGLDECVSLS